MCRRHNTRREDRGDFNTRYVRGIEQEQVGSGSTDDYSFGEPESRRRTSSLATWFQSFNSCPLATLNEGGGALVVSSPILSTLSRKTDREIIRRVLRRDDFLYVCSTFVSQTANLFRFGSDVFKISDSAQLRFGISATVSALQLVANEIPLYLSSIHLRSTAETGWPDSRSR